MNQSLLRVPGSGKRQEIPIPGRAERNIGGRSPKAGMQEKQDCIHVKKTPCSKHHVYITLIVSLLLYVFNYLIYLHRPEDPSNIAIGVLIRHMIKLN